MKAVRIDTWSSFHQECLAQVAFWRQELAGAPEMLALPTAQPRPPVASGEGCNIPFNVSPGLLASIRQLAQQHSCTLLMFFTAVYQVTSSNICILAAGIFASWCLCVICMAAWVSVSSACPNLFCATLLTRLVTIWPPGGPEATQGLYRSAMDLQKLSCRFCQ